AGGLREEGYAVDLSADGEEAMHLAQVNPYDGIVLDLMLPRMDGWTILRTLRRQGNSTPILCLTARDAVEDRVRGLDQGADEHLYDQHDEATSNVVDVYIGYLRNKIDRDAPMKLIHTKRGQGYMLGVQA